MTHDNSGNERESLNDSHYPSFSSLSISGFTDGLFLSLVHTFPVRLPVIAI